MNEISFFDISHPAAHDVVPLEHLFDAAVRVARSPLGRPARNTLPPPPRAPVPSALARAFVEQIDLPAPGVYLLRDVTAMFHFALSFDDAFLLGTDYCPSYYRDEFFRLIIHYQRLSQPRPIRCFNTPVYVPWLWKYDEYGHFLVEMLPSLLIIPLLYKRGLRYPVIVPTEPTYLMEAAATVAPELELIPVDNYNTTLMFEQCLVPVSGTVEHAFHPETARHIRHATDGVAARRGLVTCPAPNRRTFLSRVRFTAASTRQRRGLANERELHEVARSYGFHVVEPQELSFADQMLLMTQSAVVTGEASSALHNAIFSEGTDVISLGWMNNVQTMIAGLRHHRLTYVLPPDGLPSLSDARTTLHRFFDADSFEVPRELFQEAVEAALADTMAAGDVSVDQSRSN